MTRATIKVLSKRPSLKNPMNGMILNLVDPMLMESSTTREFTTTPLTQRRMHQKKQPRFNLRRMLRMNGTDLKEEDMTMMISHHQEHFLHTNIITLPSEQPKSAIIGTTLRMVALN